MKSVEDRFWSKVDKTAGAEGCWPWTRGCSGEGYGYFFLMGKDVCAHRVAYELATGDSAGLLEVEHSCRNRSCCNPAHLRLATHKQNMENMADDGMRGVSLVRGTQRWCARVQHHNKGIHVGYFDSAEEAASAARIKRLELFTHNAVDRPL